SPKDCPASTHAARRAGPASPPGLHASSPARQLPPLPHGAVLSTQRDAAIPYSCALGPPTPADRHRPRARPFLGPSSSTAPTTRRLAAQLPRRHTVSASTSSAGAAAPSADRGAF